MKKTLLIFSLIALLYGCAGGVAPVINNVETDAYKSNRRVTLYIEDHNAELTAQGDEFIIAFNRKPVISPVAEARLRTVKYPCAYAGVENRDMKFICVRGAKVYPEIWDDLIDLIFTE